MPILQEKDFDKIAARVVDQYLSGHAKLADAAAKEATASEMNPDQIHRLVQAANTMTFLRMMDQRKEAGAGDLMHEFDPIDAQQVIRIVIDDAGVHVIPPGGGDEAQGMSAAPGMDELPDEHGGMNPAEGMPGHTDTPMVEGCEEECHDKLDPPGVKTEKKPKTDEDQDEPKEPPTPKQAEMQRARMRKLAGVLDDQFHQAQWSFEDKFNRLAQRFKLAYNAPSFALFEKDAMAEHGDTVGVGVMNLLREQQRLPAIEVGFHKTAGDHCVTLDSPELTLFEELTDIATKAAQLRRGIELVRSRCV